MSVAGCDASGATVDDASDALEVRLRCGLTKAGEVLNFGIEGGNMVKPCVLVVLRTHV